MRSLAPALFALSLLVSVPALACDRDDFLGSLNLGDDLHGPAHWAPRRDSHVARLVITSIDGGVDLLLTRTAVAFQLSDRTMDRVERRFQRELNDREENAFGDAIKTAIIAGVRVILKHSAECPLYALRDVDYRDGRLVFVTEDGGHVFDQFRVNDENISSSFRERDAKAFVREFRAAHSTSH